MADDLTHAARQMLLRRPWEAAGPGEIWEITGESPAGRHSFTRCLAMTLPDMVAEGDYRPMFTFISPALTLADGGQVIPPAWIWHARPLLLVHRDEPTTAYYDDDQDLLDRTAEVARGTR